MTGRVRGGRSAPGVWPLAWGAGGVCLAEEGGETVREGGVLQIYADFSADIGQEGGDLAGFGRGWGFGGFGAAFEVEGGAVRGALCGAVCQGFLGFREFGFQLEYLADGADQAGEDGGGVQGLVALGGWGGGPAWRGFGGWVGRLRGGGGAEGGVGCVPGDFEAEFGHLAAHAELAGCAFLVGFIRVAGCVGVQVRGAVPGGWNV